VAGDEKFWLNCLLENIWYLMSAPKRHFEEQFDFDYYRAPGKIVGRFLTALRDDKKLIASLCLKCDKKYLPPEPYCPYCREKIFDFSPVAESGIIDSFTRVETKSPYYDVEPPYYFIAIKYADTDTLFWHRLNPGQKAEDGKKVKPVFKEDGERIGDINDILYFELC